MKQSWIVKMRCVVIKNVYVENCTREEAAENPWDYAENEDEIIQEDWEVLSVGPNG